MQAISPPDARAHPAGRRSAHGRARSTRPRCSSGCARRICPTRSCSSSSPCRRPPSCRTSTAACATGAWSSAPRATSQAVRDAQEGEAGYTTEDMEALIKEALRLRCSRIDIFFMIGLPAQTRALGARHRRVLRAFVSTGRQAAVLLHLADGSLHRSRQPRLRGARAIRLPPVRPHLGGAPPAARSSRPGSASSTTRRSG